MTEAKSPIEQALDLFVYAPVGLALTAAEELPKLIEKGRQRLNGQLTMARMMGEFAVNEGQKRAEKFVRNAGERAGGSRPATPPAPPATPPAAPRETTTTVATAPPPADAGPVTEVGTDAPSTNGTTPHVPADLAIPGYDALSASQVVQRLAGLAPDELEAVRDYESSHRGRKTILGRISQLQTGG
jgi:hypothetical protein